MDKLSPEQRKKNMKAVKSKGSKIETILGKEMWKNGIRYRKNYTKIVGKPDFAITKHKIAIFCDSEFWHGKDWETKKYEIKSNRDFWVQKIQRNIDRDIEVTRELNSQGWIVLRFWGKQITNNTQACVNKIIEAVNSRKK